MAAVVLALIAVLAVASAGARPARDPLRAGALVEDGEKLVAAEAAPGYKFGLSVSVSADGNTALVGGQHAPTAAAWVYARKGSSWVQQGPALVGSEEGAEECTSAALECGAREVALSADGHTALVAAPADHGLRGAAWVFVLTDSGWAQQGAKLVGSEEHGEGAFGRSVALSADGNTALIGGSGDAAHHGAAWVFARAGGTWSQQGPKLTGGEEVGEGLFGRSVALSADGSFALVGGPGDAGFVGAVWSFARTGSTWSPSGAKLRAEEEQGVGRFGGSVALSADGSTALVGARRDNAGAGAAWPYVRSGGAWVQQGAKLVGEPSGASEVGSSVALSGAGDIALLGAPTDNRFLGSAWLFTHSAGGWAREPRVTGASESGKAKFGASAALSGDGATAMIGGPGDNGEVGAVWTLRGETPPPPPPAPVPIVTSVTPSTGPAAGGTAVTIKGSGFLAGATVTIGKPASGVVVVSETELTAITAAGTPGADEVLVSDADGTSSGGPSFTYLAPTNPPANPEPTELLPHAGTLASVVAQIPPPQLGISGNIAPVSGTVLIELPGGGGFVPLNGIRQVPFGTIVDATLGTVVLTTANGHGQQQTIQFYSGEFKVTQRHSGQVLSTLTGGSFSGCPKAKKRHRQTDADVSRSSGKRVVRKLWASGHGSYATKGNYASGAVLGTRWLTEDLCGGTLIRVLTDKVAVTNLVTHKRIIVKAGHSYLAKAP
jgi:hypothetical protein